MKGSPVRVRASALRVRHAHLLSLTLAVAGLAGCGGEDKGGSSASESQSTAHLRGASPAFIQGARLQEQYTCDGAGREPVVKAGTVPPSTSELVVIMSDPDAAAGTFVHVTRYGLPSRGDGTVSEGGVEGRNGSGEVGWTPPCPPPGSGRHDYVWTVYALRDKTGLAPGADPEAVMGAVRGALATGSISATYSR